MRKSTDVLIINGLRVPAPDDGYSVKKSVYGKWERNTKNEIVGHKIGRTLYKIDGLEWSMLKVSDWKAILDALAPYTVPVTFLDDTNQRVTHTMYPSDTTANPTIVKRGNFLYVKSCKFNLIDCGWND